MSKVFQIEANICYWDATRQFPTVESTVGFFPPNLQFVEAPDYVFEGWGYVDGEFIKPTPPDGWLYDDSTGTFYIPDNGTNIGDLSVSIYSSQETKNESVEDIIAELKTAIQELYSMVEGIQEDINKLKNG